jgi:predicted Zn-dependent protease with MMP-like domain
LAYRAGKQRFAELVERALSDLPEPFVSHLEEISVEIRDRPTLTQLKKAGLGRNELLLGLYVGHPLTQRSVQLSGQLPDVIYIFQEDIELASDSEDELVEQVRVTVLHEIGHHFGMDEDDLDELGYG